MSATRGLIVAVAVLLGSGCGTLMDGIARGSNLGALATGTARAAGSQLPIGEEEELAYGGAIAVMVVQRYGGVVEDEALLRYVGLVGNAVAAVSDRPTLRYHFAVLDSPQVNAMAAPGGYVFITLGALKQMKTEAELAGVLAHEVGHITAKHALNIIQNLKSANALSQAAGSVWNDPQAFSSIVDGFLRDFLEKGLPRDTEYASDLIGTELLARIGYHPRGLRDFLGTMQAVHAHQPKTRFSETHPDTTTRLARLDRALAALPVKDGQVNAARFASQAGARISPPAAPAVEPPAAQPAAQPGADPAGAAAPASTPPG